MAGMDQNSAHRLHAAGVGWRHAEQPIDSVTSPAGWTRTLETLITRADLGTIVILLGPYGTGKTQLAVEWLRHRSSSQRIDRSGPGAPGVSGPMEPIGYIGRHPVYRQDVEEYAQRRRQVRYIKASELFRRMRDAFSSDYFEQNVMAQLLAPSALVIDELDNRAMTAFEERSLRDVIDDRYRDRKDTMLIGNQTAEQFLRQAPEYLRNRLNEVGMILECTWPSFRRRRGGTP